MIFTSCISVKRATKKNNTMTQQYNPEEYVSKLDIEELKNLIKSHDARYRIIVQMNKLSLFRYEKSSDTMYFWGEGPNGDFINMRIDNYLQEKPSEVFDKSEKEHIPETIIKILNDPEYPKTGAEVFRNKDGQLVECEYTTVDDSNGTPRTIVGQVVDYFRTPKALQRTIDNMNNYIATIEGLKSGYETVLAIDLTDYSFQIVKATPEVVQGAKQCSSVLELAKVFAHYFIDEKHHPGFQEFVDPTTLASRLYGFKYISYDYLTKNLGWVHARIVPTVYDEDGNVTQALFTTEETNEGLAQMNYLKVAAERDALTGLFNRHKGEQEIGISLTEKTPAIFAVFDCDHFKMINDTLGHPVGDKVLTAIANAMKSVFNQDVVMRLGGDEFIIFITNPELIEPLIKNKPNIFDSFTKKINEIKISELKGRKISLSGGYTYYNGIFPTTFDKLYHKADRALYQAKQTRNGTISYTV